MDVLPGQVQAAEERQLNHYALIIFVKNPVLGKVKTRLAASVGKKKALRIYNQLLEHTFEATKPLICDKFIFYSDFIPEKDMWISSGYTPCLQKGNDLGERMRNAFLLLFSKGYDGLVIIGSDCFQLEGNNLTEAFGRLGDSDVVVGPAHDGGYYLLGMKQLQECFFVNKSWSTENVFNQTVRDCINNRLSYFLLPVLRDIDDEEDWNWFNDFKIPPR